jgi:hypothetical protein
VNSGRNASCRPRRSNVNSLSISWSPALVRNKSAASMIEVSRCSDAHSHIVPYGRVGCLLVGYLIGTKCSARLQAPCQLRRLSVNLIKMSLANVHIIARFVTSAMVSQRNNKRPTERALRVKLDCWRLNVITAAIDIHRRAEIIRHIRVEFGFCPLVKPMSVSDG